MSAILSRPQAVVAAPPPAVAPAARAASQRRHSATFLQRRLHPAADVTAPGPARRLLPPTRAAAVEELAPAGSVDIESLEYVDGCFSVQGCLITAASPDTVYQVLTDYDSLPRVFHNVESSMLRQCPDSGQKQLVQTCKWAFLVFSGTFVNELNVVEDAPSRKLTFSLVESAFMKEFVGSWDVQPAADGLTKVRHCLSVKPMVAPPQKIGDLSKKIFKKQVMGILEDLKQELERQ
ncbi:hypothetical protein ABPG77_008896 [Micractinium sp. CCAP 211/92]